MYLSYLADAVAGTFLGLGVVGLILVALTSLFWLWMLIDSLTNTALNGTEKIIWVLVVFFGHVIGAVIYFFVGRSRRAGV